MSKYFMTAFAFFLSCFSTLVAQQPVLRVAGKDSGSVKMNSLKIEVSVTGNIATTTMTMKFCNSTNRVLEGELTFPMPEGVSISRYALDINGKLREAVPVEKEKGQVVFENIVRRGVDPGLLEKVEGNSFRTRIYPIPANGCRTVVMAYEQELKMTGQNALLYNLPLQFNYPIANFSTSFTIYSSAAPEVGEDCNTKLKFRELKNVFSAATEQKNFKPRGGFMLQIPKMADAAEVQVQQANGQYYFLVNSYPQAKPREKPMPAAITLLWDGSLSGRNRDHDKEFALLDAWFKKAGSMTVQLAQVDFLYEKMSTYTVSGGDWSALRKALENTVYDGATNYSSITNWPAAAECLFFTDGLNTWGNAEAMARAPHPVYTISAAAGADFSRLRMIAAQSGGAFVNLNALPVETALQQLTQQQLQLINVELSGQVSEVYPSIATPITGNCTVTGISATPQARITLQLGYGKTVTESKTIDIDAEKQGVASMNLPKVWAQQKIAQLDMQYEVFKTLITDLGKQHGIVTRNTSLIVLDDVADYVQYDIEPPAELRAEYNRLMAIKEKKEQQAEKKTIDQALKFFNDVKQWWDKDYTLARMKAMASGRAEVQGDGRNAELTGRITDDNGDPIAGATVMMARNGTSTRTDGSFRLRRVAGVNEVQISMLGFQTMRVNVAGGSVVNASLRPQNQALENVVVSSTRAMADSSRNRAEDEAVVVGTEQRARRNLRTSVPTLSAEQVNAAPRASLEQGLAGAVPGVRVSDGNAATLSNGIAAESIRRSPDRSTSEVLRRVSGSTPVYEPYDRNIRAVRSTTTANGTLSQREASYWANGSEATNARSEFITMAIPDHDRDPDGSKGIFKDTLIAVTEADKASAKLIEVAAEQPYLKQLDSAAGGDLYKQYIAIRQQHEQTPSFYFDVAKYFFRKGDTTNGLKILSNLADLNVEDHELYKMLGYQLKALGRYAEALPVFKKVLEWRPQEPQSFRDYGLALADAGKYQNALDTLYASLLKNFNGEIAGLYPGIEEITVTEINNILALHGSGLNTAKLDKRIVKNMPLDIRVVLNWNMNDTDIDLWTIDPNGEKCFYSNKLTHIGGRNSNDFTRGYGPEQFMLKKALNGKYEVKLHFYGNSVQKLAGSTTVMAEIFTHYGSPQQQRQVIALQMEKGERQEGILVGEFEFGEK